MIADVALPIPVGKSFSYTVPGELSPFTVNHLRVLVPFHNKEVVGVVVDVRGGDDPMLKPVTDIAEAFPSAVYELPALIEWSSSHYVTPPGLVFKYALPPLKNVERFLTIETGDETLSGISGLPFRKALRKIGRRKFLQYYKEGSLSLRDTLTGCDFSPGTVSCPPAGIFGRPGEKILFIDSIENRFDYYTSLISQHLQDKRNVMFLLPDYYAAGALFTKKLKALYGENVLWFTSGTTLRQKMEAFFKARREGGNLILGNKSCVFLPVKDLSLIIAERYEDDEYRNEEGFKFNAVRLAIEKARLRDASIVLGGASCSVDLFHLAGSKDFTVNVNEWIHAGCYPERTSKKGLPSTGELLDELSSEIRQVAADSGGTRIAVYTPRKDHGGFLRCQACRQPLTCPECAGPLNYNKEHDVMLCPGCGGRFPYEGTCPSCGSNMIGFSRISAQFIEEHLQKVYPHLKVIRITGDSLKKEISMVNKLSDTGTVVLVGTQSLSKLYGVHVDKLILAGWEELRKMSGHRSEEKAHQVITNIIDALTPGDVLCLSGRKEVPDLQGYLGISSFCSKELQKRKEADFPPFTRAFLVQVRKKTRSSADAALKKIRKVISEEGLESALFGALPLKRPPFHIWRVVLKGDEKLLHKAFKKLYDIPGVELEADPPSF